MRAVVITQHGGPEVLQIKDIASPDVTSGHVGVRVVAAALNRADVLQRRGFYPAPDGVREDIPGLEFAGEVEALGEGCERFVVGDRVMAIVPGAAQAEHVVVPEAELMRIPAGLSFQDAAAIPEAFLTAWDALVVQCFVVADEFVLVHAVGSGVGTAAIQLAHYVGARAIGTSRTLEKLQQARRLGMEHGLLLGAGFGRDETAMVRGLSGGAGVHVVLDLVGAAYLSGNLRVLRDRGRMMTLGLLGGRRGELDFGALLARRLTLMGSTLRARSGGEKAALVQAFSEAVLPGFEEGRLRPVVDRVLPMAAVREAHEALERDETFGSIVLTWENA